VSSIDTALEKIWHIRIDAAGYPTIDGLPGFLKTWDS